MLPVFKEATRRGIPVATYAWGYVSNPGKDYLTVVGEDTCALGKAYAKVMNTQVKSGKIAFLGGPGNPLARLAELREAALNKNIEVVANEATNWDPSKVQEVVAGILARHPDIKGWSYEYGLGMAHSAGAFAAYKAAGVPFNAVLTLRTDDGHGLRGEAAQEPQSQGLLLHGGTRRSASP